MSLEGPQLINTQTPGEGGGMIFIALLKALPFKQLITQTGITVPRL